jgi:hypothetical protein
MARPRGGFGGGVSAPSTDLRLIGAANALAGTVRYTPGSGYTGTAILPPDQVRVGDYLIVEIGGTWPPAGPIGNQPFNQGDWIISDGGAWNRILLGGAPVLARNVTVDPPVHGQDNVQDGLESTVNRNGDTMTGDLTLAGLPTQPGHAASRLYVDNSIALIPLPPDPDFDPLLPRDGSRPMTGDLTLAGLPTQSVHAASRQYVDESISAIPVPPAPDFDPLLPRDGSRPMTGDLTLAGLPTDDEHAASKEYVDLEIAAIPPADLDPLLPRDGSRPMTGDLVLFRDPEAPNQAATRNYVDRLFAHDLHLIGAANAPAGTVRYTPGSGYTGTALFPADQARVGEYLIVEVGGNWPPGTPDVGGLSFNVGDMILSDGLHWNRLALGGTVTILASQVALSPQVHGQNNVQAGLQSTVNRNGDSMAGELGFTTDGLGVTFFSGGRIYKAVGTGIIIRCHSVNTQPQIENNDGTNRRPILDANNGVRKAGDTMTGALIIQGNTLISKLLGTTTGRVTLAFGSTTQDHFHLFRNSGETGFSLDAIDAGGTVRQVFNAVRATGVLTIFNSISFGSLAQSDPRDISRHIALWGGGTTGFGINITPGHINIIAANANTNRIGFQAGTSTTPVAEVSNTGIHVPTAPTANDHLTNKLYVDQRRGTTRLIEPNQLTLTTGWQTLWTGAFAIPRGGNSFVEVVIVPALYSSSAVNTSWLFQWDCNSNNRLRQTLHTKTTGVPEDISGGAVVFTILVSGTNPTITIQTRLLSGPDTMIILGVGSAGVTAHRTQLSLCDQGPQ